VYVLVFGGVLGYRPHAPAGMIMEREVMLHFVETVRGWPRNFHLAAFVTVIGRGDSSGWKSA
jgi:hypothetical protein